MVAEGDRVMTREEIVALADAVAGDGGIASGIGTPSYGTELIVEADTDNEAVESAVATLERAAERAGLPPWPVSRAEVVAEDHEWGGG